jgi:succinate-semialdehyde dehydrogenase / glutarate-semialdehyde dehydrogenase
MRLVSLSKRWTLSIRPLTWKRSAIRIYVEKDISKAFTAKPTEAAQKLKTGPNLDPSTTQGPLVNEAAVKKAQAHVQDAVSKDAKIETGGDRVPGAGFYFNPTVLSGATSDMIVANDETFGPLAAVFEFETEAEVLRLANDTEFGLAGYFFSQNIGRWMRVARKLQVGMVGVNTGNISAAEAPFGGVKESGYGREGSLYGLEEYQIIKSVTIGNQNR